MKYLLFLLCLLSAVQLSAQKINKDYLFYPQDKGNLYFIFPQKGFISENKTDIKVEDFARRQKLTSYCNFGEYEKLYAEIPIQADFFRQQKRWNSYYYALSKEIEILPLESRYESALRKAQKLYDQAQREQHPEGIGVATYCIGYIYHSTNRNEEAETYLRKALSLLEEAEEYSTLVNCYFKLCETLSTLKKYEAAISVTQQYGQFISKLEKIALEKKQTVDYYGLWHMCYYNYAYAYYGLKDTDKVEYYYNLMCENQGESSGFTSITLIVKRMLAWLNGDIPYFMSSIDSLMFEYRNTGSLFFATELLDEKAEVLMDSRQFEDAAKTYKEIIFIKDSLNKENMAVQLDDLRSIYELDRLTAEKEKNRLHAIIAFSASLFLATLLIIYILYSRRLKEKNRNLFMHIQELARIEKEQQRIEREEIIQIEKLQETVSIRPDTDQPTDPSREEMLVKRLRVWLNTDNRFTQSDVNRKQMADYLGTNEKYLADAIRTYEGVTVNDFINRFRIEHARYILEENQQITALSVAIESGFSTRITLFRLFRKYYNTSPSEFRKKIKHTDL